MGRWLQNEVLDLGVLQHSLLFSSGIEFQVRFRDFDFAAVPIESIDGEITPDSLRRAIEQGRSERR